MNELQIDRRAAACSLYFGLKAPYVVLPFGFGFIYHGIIAKNMTSSGVAMGTYDISLGIVCLIGVASAIGDAGSPASDSTLGPTMGLNADGQHDHIWDTCVPTFVAYNIPLFAVGVLGSVLL